MIDFSIINKRKYCLNRERVKILANPTVLVENCILKPNINDILKLVKNWRDISIDEQKSLNICMSTCNEIYNKINNTHKNKLIYSIEEDILYSLSESMLKKNKKMIDQFDKMNNSNLNTLVENILIIDRILGNQNKLDKFCNFSNVIKENYATDDSIENCIYEACKTIDTLKSPVNIKTNVALENIKYTFHENGICCNDNILLETVSNYFLSKNEKDKVQYVLENNILFKQEKEKVIMESSIDNRLDKSKKIIPLLNNFRKDIKDTGLSGLKKVINKFFTLSDKNIINETPNLLTWMRKFLILSTVSISGYITIIAYLTDKYIEMGLKRKETQNILNEYKSERDKAEKMMKLSKKNETKNKYKIYIKELDSNIEKIKDYNDGLYSENELAKMNTNESFNLCNDEITVTELIDNFEYIASNAINIYNKANLWIDKTDKGYMYMDILPYTEFKDFLEKKNNINNYILKNSNQLFIKILTIDIELFTLVTGNDDDDTIWEYINEYTLKYLEKGLPDDIMIIQDQSLNKITLGMSIPLKLKTDQDVVEIETLKELKLISEINDSIINLNKNLNILNIIENNKKYIDDEIIYNVLDILKENCLLDKTKLKQYIVKHKKTLYENSNIKIPQIPASKIDNIKFSTNEYNIDDYIIYNEVCNIVNESSTASIKLALNNLRKKSQTLKDKEKIASKQMDNALDRFYGKMERELTNKNRERVIKGTLLPSLSSIIKLAVTSGAAYMINPALSVITFVSGFAMSKRGTSREKQYILDEIDIQIKMVERKIQLAESNNDMKSLEQLLRIEQKLKREKQRIIYNKKARNYYRPGKNDD